MQKNFLPRISSRFILVGRWLILWSVVAGLAIARETARAADSNDERVEALLKQMTLEEKIGQMTQVDSAALRDKSHIQKYALGSVLSGGGSDPRDNSPQSWLNLT